MSGDEVDQKATAAGASEKPGAILRAARERLGVTQREVGDALNLPVKVIESIEADDQSLQPSPVFTRGYIRSYAKLVELDPEAVVAGIDWQTPETSLLIGNRGVLDRSGPRARIREYLMQGRVQLALGAVLLLVLVLSAVALIGGGTDETRDTSESQARESSGAARIANPESVATNPTSPARTTTPDSRTGSGSSPANNPRSEGQRLVQGEGPDTALVAASGPGTIAATRATASSAPRRTENAERNSGAVVHSSGSGSGPVAADAAGGSLSRRVTAQGDDRLLFRFVDECWVEVKSVDGRNLYSNLSRSGQTLELRGQAPFRVLLGYAPGATLAFNGESVPLNPHTRNNVASLVLGQ